jgi:hypothetical protein
MVPTTPKYQMGFLVLIYLQIQYELAWFAGGK